MVEEDATLKVIIVTTGRFLRNHMLWISRILAFLGVLSILLDFIGLNLWKFLRIDTPDLTISVSLLFFWFSIEIINKVPQLIKDSLSELVSQFYVLIGSEKIDKEIKDNILKYEKVDIFAYTAETLDSYLPEAHKYASESKGNKVKVIRLLTRSWIIEKKCEDKYNQRKKEELENLLKDKKEKWDEEYWNKIKWSKFSKMEYISKTLNTKFIDITNIKIEQRFYKEAPLFRCYIFGNERYEEAYIGFYEWQENPERGSPYKGVNEPLFHITDKTIEGKKMLDIIVSRFEHSWRNNKYTVS